MERHSEVKVNISASRPFIFLGLVSVPIVVYCRSFEMNRIESMGLRCIELNTCGDGPLSTPLFHKRNLDGLH